VFRRPLALLALAAVAFSALAETGSARRVPGKPKATSKVSATAKQRARRLAESTLLPNGSFEGTLSGWYGYRSTLSLWSGNAVLGTGKALVTGTAGDFSILSNPRPVAATLAGASYLAEAWVRSDRPGRRVCVREREYSGNNKIVGSAERCVTASTSWQRVGPAELVARGGGPLDVYAYQAGGVAGDSFEVDAFSLSTGAPAPPPPPPAPDFSIAASPSSVEFVQGAGADVSISLTLVGATPLGSPAVLSVAGLPAGATATVAPASISAGQVSQLAISSSIATAPGTYSATVAAVSDGITRTTPLTVTVTPQPVALSARAVDNAHILLAWGPAPGAVHYRVKRSALVVGETADVSFTDNLLWPATPYDYTVDALNSAGTVVATQTVSATTEALPAAGFQRPYPATSFWNTPIAPDARVHPNNAGMMQYFLANARYPNLALRAWSVAVAEAHPSDPVYDVPCWRYRCYLQAYGPFQIPLTAQPDASTDGHLVVYDPATQREWSMSRAARTDTGWQAAAGGATSMLSDWSPPPEYATGNAANFPLLGGIVRPEELLQGRIDHALVFAMPGVGAGAPVCPASHNAGSATDLNALREGQKVQLDPALDVDSLALPAWQKTIARAMQRYGAYLRDGSGSLVVYAENPIARGYDAWANLGFAGSNQLWLTGFPWDQLRVLDAPDYPNC
jgi:hypothetical protein